MTLVSDLKKVAREVTGNFVSIGLSFPTVESVLEKNTNIVNGYILGFDGKKKGKGKHTKAKKSKKISIKKLRKVFKKKSVDTMICNYEDIKKYLRFFVKDSVYINRGELYIYGNLEEYVIEDLESYYGRYQTKIEITEYEKEFLIKIDNSNAKNNWIKDKLYRVKDTVIYFVDVIADILVG